MLWACHPHSRGARYDWEPAQTFIAQKGTRSANAVPSSKFSCIRIWVCHSFNPSKSSCIPDHLTQRIPGQRTSYGQAARLSEIVLVQFDSVVHPSEVEVVAHNSHSKAHAPPQAVEDKCKSSDLLLTRWVKKANSAPIIPHDLHALVKTVMDGRRRGFTLIRECSVRRT